MLSSISESGKIYDISPMISSSIAVFPGDTSFKNTFLMSFAKGDHLSLSSIHSTVHLGAHADAPSHYHSKGQSIDVRDLSLYMGKTQVLSIPTKKNHRIGSSDLSASIQAPRVLFKTNSFPNPYQLTSYFMSLST